VKLLGIKMSDRRRQSDSKRPEFTREAFSLYRLNARLDPRFVKSEEKFLVLEGETKEQALSRAFQACVDLLDDPSLLFSHFYLKILFISKELDQNPKAFERMKKLRIKDRHELIVNVLRTSSFELFKRDNGLKGILLALELANYKELYYVENIWDEKALRIFLKKTKRLKDYFRNREVSENFKNEVMKFIVFSANQSRPSGSKEVRLKEVMDDQSDGLLTILLLLRNVCGENRLLEILQRIQDEDFEWTGQNLGEFVDNWEEIRDYPLTWAANLQA
jgi:hypothetical protein